MFDHADLSIYTRTSVDITTANLARELATGVIQSETGQLFTAGETTIRLEREGTDATKVYLPQVPARTITTVVDDDGTEYVEDTDFVLRGQALVNDSGWVLPVTVTYTHGFDTVPQVVRAVALACAARFVTNPTGVRQVTVADVSTSYAGSDDDLTSGVYLTDRERHLLMPFKVQRPIVQMR